MDLYPFQKEAVEKTVAFLKQRGCCYNGSEQGVGKCCMALSTVNRRPEGSSVLIICPAIVTLVWDDEIKKWGDPLKDKYTVISYNKAAEESYYSVLKQFKWDFLIIDEAQYIKNPDTQRSKAVFNHLWPLAKYVICLSGTPMTQSIMDMWPIVSRMAPEDFADYWDFARNYTNVIRTPWGPRYKFEGIKNHEKLKKIFKSKFFFRYTKEEVFKDLPDKVYQAIPLGREYKVPRDEAAHKNYVDLLQKAISQNRPMPRPPKAIATELQEQGVRKVPAVVEFAKNILDTGTPIVVFFYHSQVGNLLEAELKKYGPVKIEGATTEAGRKEAIEKFQAGHALCFLGQIKASGIGITLTRSSTVLFAELSFSPADVSQAVDRCHRLGQRNSVNVYYFPVLDSLDEKVQEILFKKSSDFKKVLAA